MELLRRQHRLQGAEDGERPVAQRPALVLRDAEHVADQLHRDGGGEVLDQVDRAALGGASSRRSTSASMRGCSAFSARGVNAGASSLRTRVWIGGSLKTRLVVWCSYSGLSPKVGLKWTVLSELQVCCRDRSRPIVVAGEEIRAVRHAMHRIVLAQRAIGRIGVVQEFAVEVREIEDERHGGGDRQASPLARACSCAITAQSLSPSPWATAPTSRSRQTLPLGSGTPPASAAQREVGVFQPERGDGPAWS